MHVKFLRGIFDHKTISVLDLTRGAGIDIALPKPDEGSVHCLSLVIKKQSYVRICKKNG